MDFSNPWYLPSLPPVSCCRDNDFDYLEFRLWIGLWSAFQCLILVATDASFLVKYFTRFTEEGFSSLISFIFIYDAFKKMIKLADYYPINSEFKVDYITHYSCACEPLGPGKRILNWPSDLQTQDIACFHLFIHSFIYQLHCGSDNRKVDESFFISFLPISYLSLSIQRFWHSSCERCYEQRSCLRTYVSSQICGH